MNRKQLISRLTFGFLFIGIAAVGGSFIAKGVAGILDQNKTNKVDGGDALNPNSPSGSHPGMGNSPIISHKGNIDIKVATQPLTWGRVTHYNDKPDEYPSFVQYKKLVKIINHTNQREQGLILDFFNPDDESMYFDHDLMNSILQHITVKGYVYFNKAQSDSSGTNGGTSVVLPIGENCTLYKLLANNNYITLSATNSLGHQVPPSFISLELTYSTDVWYYNSKKMNFNLPNIKLNSRTYQFNLNIIGK